MTQNEVIAYQATKICELETALKNECGSSGMWYDKCKKLEAEISARDKALEPVAFKRFSLDADGKGTEAENAEHD